MDRNQLRQCAVFGIDIGKNLFHVVGLDSSGARRYCSSSNERTERLSEWNPVRVPNGLRQVADDGAFRPHHPGAVKSTQNRTRMTSSMLRRSQKLQGDRRCASLALSKPIRSIFRCCIGCVFR